MGFHHNFWMESFTCFLQILGSPNITCFVLSLIMSCIILSSHLSPEKQIFLWARVTTNVQFSHAWHYLMPNADFMVRFIGRGKHKHDPDTYKYWFCEKGEYLFINVCFGKALWRWVLFHYFEYFKWNYTFWILIFVIKTKPFYCFCYFQKLTGNVV